jgi:hypothetical protein
MTIEEKAFPPTTLWTWLDIAPGAMSGSSLVFAMTPELRMTKASTVTVSESVWTRAIFMRVPMSFIDARKVERGSVAIVDGPLGIRPRHCCTRNRRNKRVVMSECGKWERRKVRKGGGDPC